KRHPKMAPYIQTVKNTIHLINLEKTRQKLTEALNFISDLSTKDGIIIFVGTKPTAKNIIKKYAEMVEMPYVNERWLGGTLTNFQTISALIEKFKRMLKEREEGEWQKYTKKERLDLERELNRLEKMVGGIRNLNRLPDALYIVDIITEATAVREAKRKKLPVIAIVDTNANPEDVTYPIPANDDASKSIELITSLVTEAIKEGREKRKKESEKVEEKEDLANKKS
ncbi:MAG: 30S ribosomal protein S2, partial [Microgenomates group bacterium]